LLQNLRWIESMQWIVLLFAIAVAIYIERMLIPLASTPRLKVVIRWNYANGVMIALGSLHPWLKWAQIAFTLCMGTWAICFSRECLRIEQELENQRRILRERVEAERLKQEEEARLRWEEQSRLDMVQHLAAKGCPKGYVCELMGSDSVGGCDNWRVCRGI
jgi:hypothetical protein